jgi:hypothetical protein
MINITSIQLCKQTYDELISKDGELTQEEIDFVKKLHEVVFEYKEENFKKVVEDITKLSTNKITIKR